MVIKIITVKITENNSDKYEYVEFPVNRYSFNDKLDRAGIFGEYTVKISELANETGLKNINFFDEPTVDELNFLAKKLKEVCTDKYKALAYSVVISQHESVSIAEVINCTYGLETILIYPCNSAAEYGEIVLENELFEEAKDISDEIYELLDGEKVGKIMQERESGIFKDGYYIIPSSYEPQLVYDDVLPEAMDDWLFKLEVTVMDGDDPDEDILEMLTLPAGEKRISELEDKFGKPASEWVWLSFKSGLCALDSEAMQNVDSVERLNEFAAAVSEMSRSELVKFKAVLEKEQPKSVAEATEIFMSPNISNSRKLKTIFDMGCFFVRRTTVKNTITISLVPEKLSALTMYMKQKNTSAEEELEKFAEQLYQKNVPQNVRDFIDMMSGQSEQKPKKRSEQKKSSDGNEVIAADASRFGE